MPTHYIRSGATGAGNGADWADAYTTVAAAFTAGSPGDDFFISEDHAETTAAAIGMSSPGTAASPCRLICVNHSGSVPPVSADLRTTASVATTGNSTITFSGYCYCYGVSFTAGNAGGTASINFGSGNNGFWWRLNSCSLNIRTTASASKINTAQNTTSEKDALLEWINTTVSFGAATQGISIVGPLIWKNTSGAVTGATLPTSLFLSANGLSGWARIRGVDLSAITGNLINVGTADFDYLYLENCKLASGVTIATGTFPGQGGAVVKGVNCDSGNTNYRYFHQNYLGTELNEATVVRTSPAGASDGTNIFSRKILATGNTHFYKPFESEQWMQYWDDSPGSKTISVAIITDNVTVQNTDAWLEVEYLGTSGFPLGNFSTDAAADDLAAGANQTSDTTSTWTTTGLGTPNKQTLSVTFTTQLKGLIRVRVVVAKPSLTLWYDPQIIVTPKRSFMIGEAGIVNEEQVYSRQLILQPTQTY